MEPQPNEPFDPHASPKREATGASDRDVAGREAPSQAEIIRIGGILSPKDLFAANKLAHRERPSDAIVVAAVFFALSLGLGVTSAVTHQSGWLGLAAISLVVAIGIGLEALYAARRIKRCWRQQRGIFRPQRVEITEEGIRQQTDGSSVAYRWNAFSKYAASKRVVILHFDPPEALMHSMRGYLIIPRELFPSEGDWDRFVRLVQGKLPKKYHEDRAVEPEAETPK
jgi:hypothetical protein